jgi:phosphoserine phosphatase
VRAELAARYPDAPSRLTVYSDHASDLPLLEAAAMAVAVDPTPELARLAAQRGWEVVRWVRDRSAGQAHEPLTAAGRA